MLLEIARTTPNHIPGAISPEITSRFQQYRSKVERLTASKCLTEYIRERT